MKKVICKVEYDTNNAEIVANILIDLDVDGDGVVTDLDSLYVLRF